MLACILLALSKSFSGKRALFSARSCGQMVKVRPGPAATFFVMAASACVTASASAYLLISSSGHRLICSNISISISISICNIIINHQSSSSIIIVTQVFEELAVDVYDEVDRRETDALWNKTEVISFQLITTILKCHFIIIISNSVSTR